MWWRVKREMKNIRLYNYLLNFRDDKKAAELPRKGSSTEREKEKTDDFSEEEELKAKKQIKRGKSAASDGIIVDPPKREERSWVNGLKYL